MMKNNENLLYFIKIVKLHFLQVLFHFPNVEPVGKSV